MCTRCLLFAVLLFTTVGVAPLCAQAELREGDRVRVTASGVRRITGELKSLDSASLIIIATPRYGRVAIPRPAIRRLEVSRGKSAAASARKGALWGAAVWGGFNTVLLIPEGHKSVPHRIGIALFQTAIGAGLGALFGVSGDNEQWERVALTPSLSLSLGGDQSSTRPEEEAP